MTRDNVLPVCNYKAMNPYGGGQRIVPVPYDALACFLDQIPDVLTETFVFADLELLSGSEKEEALGHHRRLMKAGVTTLNDPGRTLTRVPLLKTLAEDGINNFRVHTVAERAHASFPVFLRSASRHNGNYSPLLHDHKELERAIVSQFLRRRDLDDLLIVEFRDVADGDGIYRKYGTFVINGTVIPKHVLFQRHWMVKSAGIEDGWAIEEEIEYVRSNPHEKEMLEIAQVADVGYGRVDYALVDGKIVVWEFNTNPGFNLSQQYVAPPKRAEVKDLFFRRLASCLIALDHNGSSSPANKSDPLQICKGVVMEADHPALPKRSPDQRSIVDTVTGRARPVVMPFIDRRTRNE